LTATFRGLHSFIWRSCGGREGKAELVDWHGQMARYKLGWGSSLAELFRVLEDNKDILHVSEYSLSATTLEQIFNRFVREQEVSNLEDTVVGHPIKTVGPVETSTVNHTRFLELAQEVSCPVAVATVVKAAAAGEAEEGAPGEDPIPVVPA